MGIFSAVLAGAEISQSAFLEQVRTNNDAAFKCNFLFNIFFILWMLSVLIELYHRIPIDFT